MPTYEYRCPRGHAFEKFSPRMTSHPSATCPKCGKRARRLISGGAGLVFKGSGFYITDYKRGGDKRDADQHEAKAHDATKSGNASEKASEKKSEKKSQKKDSGDK
jgi:putative FmdB family regulatory protein